MSSAPKPPEGEGARFKLLIVDEWIESGQRLNGYKLAYWLDAFGGEPAGWHGRDCGDLLNPIGWVLSTDDLPAI